MGPVLQHDQPPPVVQHGQPPTMLPPVDESTDGMLTIALKNYDVDSIMGICPAARQQVFALYTNTDSSNNDDTTSMTTRDMQSLQHLDLAYLGAGATSASTANIPSATDYARSVTPPPMSSINYTPPNIKLQHQAAKQRLSHQLRDAATFRDNNTEEVRRVFCDENELRDVWAYCAHLGLRSSRVLYS